jgi:hypothetical protein
MDLAALYDDPVNFSKLNTTELFGIDYSAAELEFHRDEGACHDAG